MGLKLCLVEVNENVFTELGSNWETEKSFSRCFLPNFFKNRKC